MPEVIALTLRLESDLVLIIPLVIPYSTPGVVHQFKVIMQGIADALFGLCCWVERFGNGFTGLDCVGVVGVIAPIRACTEV